jgi:2-oxoglutarate dehydrogenase complex dehydrogenase (E1) component-like enzyme
MPQSTDPALGINSWLEDELYHQYQFDRKSVDEGWTRLFQESGETAAAATNGGGTAVAEIAEAPPEPARDEPPQRRIPENEPPQERVPEQEPPQQQPPRQEPRKQRALAQFRAAPI